MKDHCKNDCSSLQDVETTVLVIDIPKEMLELYILSIISLQWKLLMTAIYCVDENGILCTSEPVDELSTATNLLEAYQLCGNKKKDEKARETIYITLSKCVMRYLTLLSLSSNSSFTRLKMHCTLWRRKVFNCSALDKFAIIPRELTTSCNSRANYTLSRSQASAVK